MNHTRIISLLLALFLLAGVIPAGLAAETTGAAEETTEAAAAPTRPGSVNAGTCGDGITWELSGGTLTISGSGEMDDGAPWEERAGKIEEVVFSGGVTKVGANAFSGCENLKTVDFGGAMREIGSQAFLDCAALKTIRLPQSFRIFGPKSFVGCTGLETVYCDGPMPSFKGGCFWNETHVTVYYPKNAPWPNNEVQKLMANFGWRLDVRPSEEDIPVTTASEPVPETTEPATVPTEQTQPPVTEPPETVPVTQPATTVPAETEPQETAQPVIYTLPTMATEPVAREQESKGMNGILIGILLVGGVLTFFVGGALIAKSARSKGGRYYH